MAFNGSGTYNLPAGNPVVTGTTISSSTTNTTNSDIATALTNCITRDGQSTPSANLPMNAKKLTGLAAGTAAGDSVRYEQVVLTGGALGTPTSGTLTNCTFPTLNQSTTGNALTATTATNLAGGGAGQLPYQTASGTTAMLAAGTATYVLTSNGTSAPSWQPASASGTVTSVAALTLGTTGTDVSSSVLNPSTTPVITLNIPTASASNRGALSSSDWSTFNGKYSTGGALGTPSSGDLSSCTNAIAYGIQSASTVVSVSGATAPSNGKVLTATSSTTATWQTPSGVVPAYGEVGTIVSAYTSVSNGTAYAAGSQSFAGSSLNLDGDSSFTSYTYYTMSTSNGSGAPLVSMFTMVSLNLSGTWMNLMYMKNNSASTRNMLGLFIRVS
jgi:hypothetical protein